MDTDDGAFPSLIQLCYTGPAQFLSRFLSLTCPPVILQNLDRTQHSL